MYVAFLLSNIREWNEIICRLCLLLWYLSILLEQPNRMKLYMGNGN